MAVGRDIERSVVPWRPAEAQCDRPFVLQVRSASRTQRAAMRYEYTPEQLAWRDEVRAFCARARHRGAARGAAAGGQRGRRPAREGVPSPALRAGLVGRRLAEGVRRHGEGGRRAVHLHRRDADGRRARHEPLGHLGGADDPARRHRGAEGAVAAARSCAARPTSRSRTRSRTPAPTWPRSRTRAELDGDDWVINGQKIWNTGAHTATHNWVAVRTEPEAPQAPGHLDDHRADGRARASRSRASGRCRTSAPTRSSSTTCACRAIT